MKKLAVTIFIFIGALVFTTSIQSCKTSALVASKSGAQIWGENCLRCHNLADPTAFSDVEWDVAATHMQIRANLTREESRKVVEFLKSTN